MIEILLQHTKDVFVVILVCTTIVSLAKIIAKGKDTDFDKE